jgi:hypothetical protein
MSIVIRFGLVTITTKICQTDVNAPLFETRRNCTLCGLFAVELKSCNFFIHYFTVSMSSSL